MGNPTPSRPGRLSPRTAEPCYELRRRHLENARQRIRMERVKRKILAEHRSLSKTRKKIGSGSKNGADLIKIKKGKGEKRKKGRRKGRKKGEKRRKKEERKGRKKEKKKEKKGGGERRREKKGERRREREKEKGKYREKESKKECQREKER